MKNRRLALISVIALVVLSACIFFGVRAADEGGAPANGKQLPQTAFHDDDPFARAFMMRQSMMRRFFDDVFGDYPADSLVAGQWGGPAMNIHQTDKKLVITCDLPGMSKDAINVEVRDRVLTVSGERKTQKEEKDEGRKYYVQEVSYGKFSRSVMLPDNTDPDAMEAEYKDGVLTLSVPMVEVEDNAVKVAVK